jgi:hypothetical protein
MCELQSRLRQSACLRAVAACEAAEFSTSRKRHDCCHRSRTCSSTWQRWPASWSCTSSTTTARERRRGARQPARTARGSRHRNPWRSSSLDRRGSPSFTRRSVMADVHGEPARNTAFLNEVTARLTEAARNAAPLELIFAVRGRVEPVAGRRGARWRLRTGRGHVVTFRPEFVIAFNGTSDGHPEAARSRRRASPDGLPHAER